MGSHMEIMYAEMKKNFLKFSGKLDNALWLKDKGKKVIFISGIPFYPVFL